MASALAHGRRAVELAQEEVDGARVVRDPADGVAAPAAFPDRTPRTLGDAQRFGRAAEHFDRFVDEAQLAAGVAAPIAFGMRRVAF